MKMKSPPIVEVIVTATDDNPNGVRDEIMVTITVTN